MKTYVHMEKYQNCDKSDICMVSHQEAFVWSTGKYVGDQGGHTCHHTKFCDYAVINSGEIGNLCFIQTSWVQVRIANAPVKPFMI